jgi:hypothetical protein
MRVASGERRTLVARGRRWIVEASGVPDRGAVVVLREWSRECLSHPDAIEVTVLREAEALVALLRVERLSVPRRFQRNLPKMIGVRPDGTRSGSAQKSPTRSDLVKDRDTRSRSVARVRDFNYFAGAKVGRRCPLC